MWPRAEWQALMRLPADGTQKSIHRFRRFTQIVLTIASRSHFICENLANLRILLRIRLVLLLNSCEFRRKSRGSREFSRIQLLGMSRKAVGDGTRLRLAAKQKRRDFLIILPATARSRRCEALLRASGRPEKMPGG
jgi:hypothetical protein